MSKSPIRLAYEAMASQVERDKAVLANLGNGTQGYVRSSIGVSTIIANTLSSFPALGVTAPFNPASAKPAHERYRDAIANGMHVAQIHNAAETAVRTAIENYEAAQLLYGEWEADHKGREASLAQVFSMLPAEEQQELMLSKLQGDQP